MRALLSVFILSIAASTPALAQEASDMKLLNERSRSPADTLAFGVDATAEARLIVTDLAGWYGLALYEDDPDRVGCLDGKEHIARQMLRTMETAHRDLVPAVMTGQHAKVERESRQLRMAFAFAQQVHREGLECSHLVAQPIEPKSRSKVKLPPPEEDLIVWEVDPLRGIAANPW